MKHPFISTTKKVKLNHVFSVVVMTFILENFNQYNRPISKADIEKMVDDIKSGSWADDTGNFITFDENGNLVSGQHRFQAHILAGVPFKADVMFGLKPEVRQHTDNSRMRDLATRHITSNGEELTSSTRLRRSREFSICRMLKKAENGFTQTCKFADDQLISVLEEKRKYIDMVLSFKKPYTKSAGVLAAIVTYLEKHPKLGSKFMTGVLGDGSGLQAGCPILFLRNYITQRANGGSVVNTQYLVTVSAINKYHKGEQMTRASQTSEWEF